MRVGYLHGRAEALCKPFSPARTIIGKWAVVGSGRQPRTLITWIRCYGVGVTTEHTADGWAKFAAAVIGLIGLTVVVWPTLRAIDLDVASSDIDVTTKVIENEAGKTVETTTTPSNPNVLERALGEGGLFLVRLGITFGAAFVAGAVVQRTLLADFAFKAGGVELPARKVAEESADAIEALQRQVGQVEQLRHVLNEILEIVDALPPPSASGPDRE